MTGLIHAARSTRRIGGTVYVYNESGRAIWGFSALSLAVQYYSMPRETFLAAYGFVWVPDEPYATLAQQKLGGRTQ
ncbi:MAG: hypothetical protein RSG59_08225 [Ruthenibacterium sp.]